MLLKELQLSLPTVRAKIKKHLMPLYLSDYVDELTQEVMRILRGVPQDLFLFDDNSPPSLCSSYEHPEKLEAINAHRSRFCEI